MNPNKDGNKYFSYAETLTGNDAVQMYKKGIDVLDKHDIPSYKAAGMQTEFQHSQKQMASAYASIAEAFMKDPLW